MVDRMDMSLDDLVKTGRAQRKKASQAVKKRAAATAKQKQSAKVSQARRKTAVNKMRGITTSQVSDHSTIIPFHSPFFSRKSRLQPQAWEQRKQDAVRRRMWS